ncbi:MAG TPA: ABC transporter permease subunit [Candidatus Krumholzibacteria bacterium]|nr:ABC transporter permease subunit [Candidatus Krumholzibacteria bacterium]
MPIYEQGYQRWNGELQERPLRWWPIVRQGVMAYLPQRKYLLLLGLAWIQKIFDGVQVYGRLKGGEVLEGLLGARVDAGMPFFWASMDNSMIWVVIFTIMVGSDLIAADRRGKALQLYFSKPITRNDYIVGKIGVIATFLLLTTWLPILLLWLFAVMIEPTTAYFARVWSVPLLMTVYSVLLVATAGMIMLAVSATAQRSVFISVTWIVLFGYGFVPVIELVQAITGFEAWSLINMAGNLGQIGAWWFGAETGFDVPPVLALGAVLVGIVAAYWWLRRKIEPVEVVL